MSVYLSTQAAFNLFDIKLVSWTILETEELDGGTAVSNTGSFKKKYTVSEIYFTSTIEDMATFYM
jgi:flagellum-specific peptidoglycan hydrolase FlgJ